MRNARNQPRRTATALQVLLLPVLVDVLLLHAQICTSPQKGVACRANYSTHKCAGVNVNHRTNQDHLYASDGSQSPATDHNLQDGTCLFENVCIFNGELTYMVHPRISDAGSVHVPRLHALSRLWRANPREPCPNWEEVKWQRRQGYISPHLARTDVVHVYIRRIFPRNAGHVLGDDAWAIFQAMLMFDLLDYPDIQVIVDDDDGPALGAEFWSNKVFALVSGRQVMGMREIGEQHDSLCFDRFLTGWGGLGFGSGNNVKMEHREPSLWGKGSMQRQWRAFAWKHLLGLSPGREEAPGRVSGTEPGPGHREGGGGPEEFPRVSLITKDYKTAGNKFVIADSQRFAGNLEIMLQEVLGEKALVQEVSWAGMGLTDQLKILYHTDILISLPGSDVMNGIFLRDRSLVIIPCRLAAGWQRRRKDAGDGSWGELVWEVESPEAVLWLRHFPGIHTVEWCQHRSADMEATGVRLDPANYLSTITDWMIATHRPPTSWDDSLVVATPSHTT